jgi:SAM-dependent methyltransferase
MSDHGSRLVERHCDVAVVGGSAAGLGAALQLGRQRRSVIVIDDGDPGNAPAAHTHGFLGHDELSPSDSTAIGREEVRRYGVEVLAARAVDVTRLTNHHFRIELVGGGAIVARRLLTATDLTDVLPDDDDADGAPPRSNQADWDHRYSGAPIWSGNPNGTLVNEVRSMAPGRALDIGAGEGGDAIWLAQQGWQVTASDISERALDRIAAVAAERGLAVECHHADANGVDPYRHESFDLVSAHYASIQRTPDDRAIANNLVAVAVGGTLLVVGHDLEPMRRAVDTTDHSQMFDPDAYVRMEDFSAALDASTDWRIEVNEKRPRPSGAASSHHVDDCVLRARRVERRPS